MQRCETPNPQGGRKQVVQPATPRDPVGKIATERHRTAQSGIKVANRRAIDPTARHPRRLATVRDDPGLVPIAVRAANDRTPVTARRQRLALDVQSVLPRIRRVTVPTHRRSVIGHAEQNARTAHRVSIGRKVPVLRNGKPPTAGLPLPSEMPALV